MVGIMQLDRIFRELFALLDLSRSEGNDVRGKIVRIYVIVEVFLYLHPCTLLFSLFLALSLFFLRSHSI